VPLQHYLWAKGRLWNVVDQHGKWHAEAFKAAKVATEEKKKEKKWTKRSEISHWIDMVNYLKKREVNIHSPCHVTMVDACCTTFSHDSYYH
jgi:superfamily II RNA helicase